MSSRRPEDDYEPCGPCEKKQERIDHLARALGICEQARDEAQARAARLDKGVASLHEALEAAQQGIRNMVDRIKPHRLAIPEVLHQACDEALAEGAAALRGGR